MISATQEEINHLCGIAGLRIAESGHGTGREISYEHGPARTIVVHLAKADIPTVARKTLAAILSADKRWFLINRYGPLSARVFEDNEFQATVDDLMHRLPRLLQDGGDMYLIGADGKLFVLVDHHIFSDGLGLFFATIATASDVLERLNELGAELELFSNRN